MIYSPQYVGSIVTYKIMDFEQTVIDRSASIEILIVEDHPLFSQGLRRVLEGEEGLVVVGEAASGPSAVSLAARLCPDLILMDINLPEYNGMEATRQIKAADHCHKEIGIILLSAYDDGEQLYHALRAGAAAYFSKSLSAIDLIHAIDTVYQGLYVVGDEVMDERQVNQWLVNQFSKLATFGDNMHETLVPLTPREMGVLRLIAQGLSNKEIALALHISRQTVKNHMSNILRKLAVHDRTEATVLALRRGWIRLEDTVPSNEIPPEEGEI